MNRIIDKIFTPNVSVFAAGTWIQFCILITLATVIVAVWLTDKNHEQQLQQWLKVYVSNPKGIETNPPPAFLVEISREDQIVWQSSHRYLLTQTYHFPETSGPIKLVVNSSFSVIFDLKLWLFLLPFYLALGVILRRHDWRTQTRVAQLRLLSERLTRAFYPSRKTPTSVSKLVKKFNQLVNKLDNTKMQQQQRSDFIRYKTFVDAETKLGNRQFFDNRLEATLSDPMRVNYGAVFLFQATNLDLIEAQQGKGVAAELLSMIATRMTTILKNYPQAVIARHSEHDIALFLPFINAEEVPALASKIIEQVDHLGLSSKCNWDVSGHLGVALCESGETNYQIMSEADMALRAAQLQGQSGWYQYDKTLLTPAIKKGSVRWRTMLETAIEKNYFIMFYQPVIQLNIQDVHHYEILARLRESDGSLISASVFLPMASKCGLLVKLDQLMITHLLKLLTCEPESNDHCSINISLESLVDKRFLDWLAITLAKYQRVLHRVIVEINEFKLQEHEGQLNEALALLKQHNIRILIDQVGLHLVDQRYLERVHIDFLKLDQSIVRNIDSKTENQLFIRALQSICDFRSIAIFAAGVESAEEWRVLQQLGLQGGQGHYFTEPMMDVNKLTGSV